MSSFTPNTSVTTPSLAVSHRRHLLSHQVSIFLPVPVLETGSLVPRLYSMTCCSWSHAFLRRPRRVTSPERWHHLPSRAANAAMESRYETAVLLDAPRYGSPSRGSISPGIDGLGDGVVAYYLRFFPLDFFTPVILCWPIGECKRVSARSLFVLLLPSESDKWNWLVIVVNFIYVWEL